ncbi:MAG: DUF3784 domain-containing protein [Clostridium sp.]|uniref:DUF3784 domain-containing protein n=1 Tax=Clostridium sp. TaxID=1506 RepID=UPI003F2B75E9
MNENFLAVLIIGFLGGGLFTLLGGVMVKFNAGDMLSNFDPNIHDKDKVSIFVGKPFLYSGISILFFTLISFIFKTFFLILCLQLFILFLCLIICIYNLSFKCKK